MIRNALLTALGVALLVAVLVYVAGKLCERIMRDQHGDRL